MALQETRNSLTREAGIRCAKKRLDELFRDSSAKAVLISNEDLLGQPFIYPCGQFFPDAERYLAAVKEILDGYEVYILYCTKSYSSFLSSYYVQYIRRGGSCSFKQFFEAVDLQALTWQRNIDLLYNAFGKENVHVCDYMHLLGNLEQSLDKIFYPHLTGKFPNYNLKPYNKNRSFGGSALFLARVCNKLLVRYFSLSEKKAGDITRNAIFKNLAYILPKNKPHLDEHIKKELDKRYINELSVLGAINN